jgi:hypothetical protein
MAEAKVTDLDSFKAGLRQHRQERLWRLPRKISRQEELTETMEDFRSSPRKRGPSILNVQVRTGFPRSRE